MQMQQQMQQHRAVQQQHRAVQQQHSEAAPPPPPTPIEWTKPTYFYDPLPPDYLKEWHDEHGMPKGRGLVKLRQEEMRVKNRWAWPRRSDYILTWIMEEARRYIGDDRYDDTTLKGRTHIACVEINMMCMDKMCTDPWSRHASERSLSLPLSFSTSLFLSHLLTADEAEYDAVDQWIDWFEYDMRWMRQCWKKYRMASSTSATTGRLVVAESKAHCADSVFHGIPAENPRNRGDSNVCYGCQNDMPIMSLQHSYAEPGCKYTKQQRDQYEREKINRGQRIAKPSERLKPCTGHHSVGARQPVTAALERGSEGPQPGPGQVYVLRRLSEKNTEACSRDIDIGIVICTASNANRI